MNNESNIGLKVSQINTQCDHCLKQRADSQCVHKSVSNNKSYLKNNKIAFVFIFAFHLIYAKISSFSSTLFLLFVNTFKCILSQLDFIIHYKLMANHRHKESDHCPDMYSLIRQKEHHKKSFDLISNALKIDENIEDKNIGLY